MKLELNKVYRARNSSQWKIVCVYEDPNAGHLSNMRYLFLGVNKSQSKFFLWLDGGFIFSPLLPEKDRKNRKKESEELFLIELIGDDFTQDTKLREFKFEGYLSELNTTSEGTKYAIEAALSKPCSNFYTELNFVPNCFEKISKWEVTMKELPIGSGALNDKPSFF